MAPQSPFLRYNPLPPAKPTNNNAYVAGDVIAYVARSSDYHTLVTMWHVYEQRARTPDYITRRDVMLHPDFLTFASRLEKHRPPSDDYTRYDLRALDMLIMLYRTCPAGISDDAYAAAFTQVP